MLRTSLHAYITKHQFIMATSVEKKSISSVQDVSERQALGGRQLKDKSEVFAHNAWDNVEWTEEQEKNAEEKVRQQAENPVTLEQQEFLETEAAEQWNKFYSLNQNRFFKDRHWLKIEFPELFLCSEGDASTMNVMEIGCGAGNSVWPLIEGHRGSNLYVYACDFSKVAVDVVKSNPDYDETKCKAFVWDLTNETLPTEVVPGTIDVIILIFVISAIHPDKWSTVMDNLYALLKPGGRIVFRDYGRYDLAQLRFKKDRYLSENFYVRGDNTRVYFFTQDEINELFGKKFTIEQNAVDRRLLVNRGRELQMYRVWLQGKFVKPLT